MQLNFEVNDKLCIGCSRCIKVCPSGILALNEKYHSSMIDADAALCTACEYCLAVCPRGAIHIFNKAPEDSILPPSEHEASRVIDALLVNTRPHQRFLSREVDTEMIVHFLNLLANMSNETSALNINFSFIHSPDAVAHFYETFSDDHRISDLHAPCILIPHVCEGSGIMENEMLLAAAHFKLLCSSRGLGTFLLDISEETLAQRIKSHLSLPDDHVLSIMIGFGWPEITYSRGTQRHIPSDNIQQY